MLTFFVFDPFDFRMLTLCIARLYSVFISELPHLDFKQFVFTINFNTRTTSKSSQHSSEPHGVDDMISCTLCNWFSVSTSLKRYAQKLIKPMRDIKRQKIWGASTLRPIFTAKPICLKKKFPSIWEDRPYFVLDRRVTFSKQQQ